MPASTPARPSPPTSCLLLASSRWPGYRAKFVGCAGKWATSKTALVSTATQRRSKFFSPLSALTFYSGNAEGWGCYVEYLGKELGLYQQPAAELGKWEWDLVRSARVVLDVGIHDRGWTHAQALAYWQANVPGQDDIAEREINRVTNWPGQCLSYKVGAQRIEDMKSRQAQRPGFSPPRFHAAYLALSRLPLEVVERHIDAVADLLAAKPKS